MAPLRFFSLLLSWWTVLRSNPSSAEQWISQIHLEVMSRAKHYKKVEEKKAKWSTSFSQILDKKKQGGSPLALIWNLLLSSQSGLTWNFKSGKSFLTSPFIRISPKMDLMPLFSNLKEISIFARSRLEYFGCFVSTDCLKLKICGSGCSLRSRSPQFESSSFVDRLALKAGCLRAAGGTVMDCSYLQKSSLSSLKHL